MNTILLLLQNNFLRIQTCTDKTDITALGTVLSNLAYYGYIPSKDAVTLLQSLGNTNIQNWWTTVEPELSKLTGENLKMAEAVVYKNFPKEVLDMCEAEYWIRQVLMYLGVPNEAVTQEATPRQSMTELRKLKVLHVESSTTLDSILKQLLKLPAKWTALQWEQVNELVFSLDYKFNLKDIVFKENLVQVISHAIKSSKPIPLTISSATDILRLAVGLSDGDISLKTNTKFRNFKRSERKAILGMLNSSSNLDEDLSRDQEKWKRLLCNLHPFEHKAKYPKVVAAYKRLLDDKLTSFNSKIEAGIKTADETTLSLLVQRPGDFVRRLQKVLQVFKDSGAEAFITIIPKLTTIQLIKLVRYLDTVNSRQNRTIAPKGNWKKLQIIPNTIVIDKILVGKVKKAIASTLKERLKTELPTPVLLDENTNKIALQTSDSELTAYGRGTTFPIPPEIKFLRSASYWEHKTATCNWFDNGWNFFDSNWKATSACCWSTPGGQAGAAFSGDPTNAKDANGRACQLIDLQIEKLLKAGVRFAVWNILSYSKIPFSNAKVFAALQWGEDAQAGELFEPSRCQLVFPIVGTGLTKYVAYVDLEKRELVYMDANLKAATQAASSNGPALQEVMPAFVEYLETLPKVADVFKHARKGKKKGMVVTYSDEGISLKNNEPAFVFQSTNKENSFTPFDMASLLNSKTTTKSDGQK